MGFIGDDLGKCEEDTAAMGCLNFRVCNLEEDRLEDISWYDVQTELIVYVCSYDTKSISCLVSWTWGECYDVVVKDFE
jgi:hypothetical protein